MLLTLLEKIQAKQQQSHPDAPRLPKMMVFLNTAAAAQAAYDAVAAAGYPAVPFHKEVRVGSVHVCILCVWLRWIPLPKGATPSYLVARHHQLD